MIFNGVDFSQWMRCGAKRRMAPEFECVTFENGTGVGETFARRKVRPLVIPVICRLTLGRWNTVEQVATVRRRIASMLVTDAPARLVLDDEPDRYYMAIATNLDELSSLKCSGSFELEFTAHDPIAYGMNRESDVSGQTTLMVDGTHETYPVFRLESTAGPGGHVKVMDVESGLHVELEPGIQAGSLVTIDMGSETTRVNGNLWPITLASDYFPLHVGLAKVSVAGAAGTVKWTERWL